MPDLPTKLRAAAALKSAFVGDALAMPVHWYYNPMDIFRQFPGGITQFEAAPIITLRPLCRCTPPVKGAEALVEEPTHSGRSSEMSYSRAAKNSGEKRISIITTACRQGKIR